MTTSARPLGALAGQTSLTRTGYVFLSVLFIVVFEGAIRKWVTSAATLPLILLRDLLAVYLVFYVWKRGYFRRQKNFTLILFAWSCCVALWGLLQALVNDTSPLILLIGLRFWLLYIWFGYAVACAMTESDFRTATLTACGLLVVMAPLAVLQYYSSPAARINVEVDNVEGEVFTAVMGVVRTTGTFSFTSGYTTFLAVVAPLALAITAARKRSLRQTVFASVAFVLLIVGSIVSGARSAVIFTGLLVAIYLLGRLVFSRGADKGKALVGTIVMLLAVVLALTFFEAAVDTTSQRFGEAAEAENFWERVLTIFIGEPAIYDAFTWVGVGIGQGSNLAGFVRSGAATFALGETEAGRTLMEGGLIGYLFSALKMLVLAVGILKSLRIAMRTGVLFPLILWLALALGLLTWPGIGQLTANALLGILIAFALASSKYPTVEFFPRKPARR
ncbi:MAG: hypothetical protein EOP76_00980 [Variovorax sp.]|nr:MAG: hypothetical protein EOP76_00980 [Variovorax sp.]